jgi:hypothetical protein
VGIPDLKAKFEVRGKVRIGEKRQSGAKSFPAATDYFVSPDPEFVAREQLAEGKLSSLRIVLPHPDVEENFSTGLEWWSKSRRTQESFLACYTKGDGTALRWPGMLDEGQEPTGPARGQAGRLPIVCAFRDCPIFKRGKDGCKPMGRLLFFLEGGATDRVLQLDTKSWNSIERLTAALTGARLKGPLTGRVFDLSVAFETQGANRFPVLSIQEVDDVVINSPEDVEKAEALLAVERALATGADARHALIAGLDVETPDWREKPALVAKLQELGAEEALARFKARFAE